MGIFKSEYKQYSIIIPPANYVCGQVNCFHFVFLCVGQRGFVSSKVIDGISSNFVNILILTRQIFTVKK